MMDWDALEHVRRHAIMATFLALASTCSSSGGSGLPDDQVLSSPNFRYHARVDAVLDPSIMERLERHRTEFNQRFGVTNGVIDYYLFRDRDDVLRNSGCPTEADGCAPHRSVLTTEPFMEHELVHAFMSDI